MRRKLKRLAALLLAAAVTAGLLPAAEAAGGVEANGARGDELNLDPYDAMINFANVRNDKVFSWPAEGNVLVYTGTTYTPTLKKSIQKLDGMVIPANLVVDIYFDCAVVNNATYPEGYTFVAQYDTTDGRSITVDAQALMYSFDQAFGTRMAGSGATAGVPFHGFADVRAVDYYAQAVAWAAEEGITGGTSAGSFSPDAPVTRAQAVTFLWRAAGEPAAGMDASPFTDVADPGLWYYTPVLWVAEQGITGGVSESRFGPEEILSYDQIFTFLSRAAGEEQADADWSAAAVRWAGENGLTDGLAFTAKGACSRADVVYCLWKQMGQTGQTEQTGGENLTLSNLEAARAVILNGFLERTIEIDVAPYHIESDQLLAMAREIADIDGENPFGISVISSRQHAGQQAKSIGVIYLMTNSSGSGTGGWQNITEEVRAEAERVVDQLVTPGMSSYDAAKALHDYLVLNCEYDSSNYYAGTIPAVSHMANGALLEGVAVCSGYAKAYEALLDAAGIPSETVTGYAGGYHAWNLVQIDGEWYHVDVTWDDPIPDREGYVRYKYFLKSDEAMGRDHTDWDASYPCTSTRYDAELPSSDDQAKLEEQARAQQEIDELLAHCRQVIEAMPYQTQEELAAASDQELSDARRVEIPLPGGRLSREELYLFSEQLRSQIPAQYPFIGTATMGSMDTDAPTVLLYRKDVTEELQRRQDG